MTLAPKSSKIWKHSQISLDIYVDNVFILINAIYQQITLKYGEANILSIWLPLGESTFTFKSKGTNFLKPIVIRLNVLTAANT